MNIKTIVIFIAVVVGVLGGVTGLLWQFAGSTDKPILDIAGDKKHVQGSGSVTLTEFSDFQCPACSSVQEPLKQILAKYDGRVEFVYRYFPLTTIHKNAQKSAQAAEAAGLQGKFFPMHDKLFATQPSWESLANPKDIFVGYAEELGLDKDKFANDMESQEVKDAINIDSMAATGYRITGTPTFFVNGVKTDFSKLEGKIEEFLK